MHSVAYILISAWSCSLAQLAAAVPVGSSGLTYLSPGRCSVPGEFICASTTAFAICDASLQGIIQSLALGDARCLLPNVVPQVISQLVPTRTTQAPDPTKPGGEEDLRVIPVTLTPTRIFHKVPQGAPPPPPRR